ncbi:MAG: hypothetical protein Tsb0034_18030 [Ekhidna sp.]
MEVKRVSFKSILEEFLSKWIGFDNQFGRTIKDLTIAPGRVIKSYLSGNRVRYIGPLGYLVIMTALLIVSFDLFGIDVKEFLQKTGSNIVPQDTGQSSSQVAAQQKVMDFVSKNFRFLSTVLIPFLAIPIGWFLRKWALNYVERLVIATYLLCQTIWITFLMIGVYAFTGRLFSAADLIISVFYVSIALHDAYPSKNIVYAILRGFLIYLLAFVVLILSVVVISFIAAILILKVFSGSL